MASGIIHTSLHMAAVASANGSDADVQHDFKKYFHIVRSGRRKTKKSKNGSFRVYIYR